MRLKVPPEEDFRLVYFQTPAGTPLLDPPASVLLPVILESLPSVRGHLRSAADDSEFLLVSPWALPRLRHHLKTALPGMRFRILVVETSAPADRE